MVQMVKGGYGTVWVKLGEMERQGREGNMRRNK